MLDPNSAFSLAGLLAIAGWLLLLVALFVERARPIAWTAGLAIPGLIAVAYIVLIATGIGEVGGTDFGSIAEVRRVFANDSALAAGWLHYLAFDLFVGAWEARDGLARGIHPLLLIPCLILTFLFGPAGLLLYLLVRLVFSRANQETAS